MILFHSSMFLVFYRTSIWLLFIVLVVVLILRLLQIISIIVVVVLLLFNTLDFYSAGLSLCYAHRLYWNECIWPVNCYSIIVLQPIKVMVTLRCILNDQQWQPCESRITKKTLLLTPHPGPKFSRLEISLLFCTFHVKDGQWTYAWCV